MEVRPEESNYLSFYDFCKVRQLSIKNGYKLINTRNVCQPSPDDKTNIRLPKKAAINDVR